MTVNEAIQTPPLVEERRAEVQTLLAELIMLSAAAAAVQRARLSKTERARRLAPILARREAVEARLFG